MYLAHHELEALLLSVIMFIFDFLYCSGVQDLAGVIKQKAHRKRVLSRDVRWSFGAGFEIAVALYAMIQPAVKGTYTYVKAQNNEPLRSETAYICNDTGKPAREHRAALPFFSGQDRLFTGQHCLSLVGRTGFSQGSIACV